MKNVRIRQKLMGHLRYGYMFGYGADREIDMLKAITGRTPKAIGPAVLHDYELCIQNLKDIPESSSHVRTILEKGWGKGFRSYTIRPRKGKQVHGVLYRLRLSDRHAIDHWELIYAHWYDKAFIDVEVPKKQRMYRAETQVMGKGQLVSEVVNDAGYHPWLNPKSEFIRIANLDRNDKSK